MKFIKMQGAGNDFIVINNQNKTITNYEYLSKTLCNRRFGIGGDGILVVENSESADIKMIYYNSDGTIGAMCGNGIRCFSKFVFEQNIISKTEFQIETGDGIKTAYLEIENSKVKTVKIFMGKATTTPKLIPVNSNKNVIFEEKLNTSQGLFTYSSVLIGVPHTIIHLDSFENIPIDLLGKEIENNPIFPKKTNVNFIKILDRQNIEIKTWERGAGRTLACGTGSSSAVYLLNQLGYVDTDVDVHTEGGILHITLKKDLIFMSGPAKISFSGEIFI